MISSSSPIKSALVFEELNSMLLLSDSVETQIESSLSSSAVQMKIENQISLTPESRKRPLKSKDTSPSTSNNSSPSTSNNSSSSTSNKNPPPKRLFKNPPNSYSPSAPKNAVGKLFDMSLIKVIIWKYVFFVNSFTKAQF